MVAGLRTSPVTAERRALVVACAHFTSLKPELASPEMIAGATAALRDHRRPSTYARIAEFAFYQMLAMSVDQHGKPSEHSKLLGDPESKALGGAMVAGRVIGASPSPYLEFCREKDVEPSVTDLGGILLRSAGTLQPFMNVPARVGAHLEEAFSLDHDMPSGTSAPFRIEGTPEDALLLADGQTFEAAVARAPSQKADGSPYGKLDRCPARILMENVFWPGIVGLSVGVDLALPQTFRIMTEQQRIQSSQAMP